MPDKNHRTTLELALHLYLVFEGVKLHHTKDSVRKTLMYIDRGIEEYKDDRTVKP